MKVAPANDAPATDRALRRLHEKWLVLALVHYVKRGSIEWQAEQLECQPGTVLARVERLHCKLLKECCNIEQFN